MALASDPTLLILDEPTTGLDATVEAEVLDLVAALRAGVRDERPLHQPQPRRHRRMCERVGVLYAGRLVEEGAAETRLHRAAPSVHGRAPALHPARRPAQGPRPARHDPRLPAAARRATSPAASSPTAAASPRRSATRRSRPSTRSAAGTRAAATSTTRRAELPRATSSTPAAGASATPRPHPVVRARAREQDVQPGGPRAPGARDVDLAIGPGETLGLVGESGSGKTTLARVLLGLTSPDAGSVVELDGEPLAPGSSSARPSRCARSRSSSRIPTRPSTAAPPCGGSSAAR